MLSTPQNRLDPSTLDREELDRLVAAFSRADCVAVIGPDGTRTELPKPIYIQLMRMIDVLQRGSAIVIMPEDETFTTQAGANFLGMSRQFLITLLEGGKIKFHRVGAHRRIYFRDLLAYREKRDNARRAVLDELSREISDAGLYFPEKDPERENDPS